MKTMKQLPPLGTGIGFRPELKAFIFLNRDKIDFIEVIADHYIDVPEAKWRELELLKEHFTVIPHAINLSLGSAQGVDTHYVKKLGNLVRFLDPPYWSEHIAFTQAHDTDIGHLSPIVYNDDFLTVMEKNIAVVQAEIACPLILENITYHLELPGRNYSDAEFLNKLCSRTGCGLLLDLTNTFINSRNLGFDAAKFINELKAENIVQLHYVGYDSAYGQIIDTHARETQPEIFALMEQLLQRHVPRGILLERDDRFSEEKEICDDLLRAKKCYNKYFQCI